MVRIKVGGDYGTGLGRSLARLLHRQSFSTAIGLASPITYTFGDFGPMVAKTAPFRKVDISRALKGAQSAGMTVGRVEIDPSGKIILVAASETPEPKNELDRWISDHAHTS